jgi:ribosomal protein S18 acetylase RimI-like enzyme
VVVPFDAGHLTEVLMLCDAEGWPSLPADPVRAQRVLTGPGTTTLVAVDGGHVVGFASAISDGAIDAYLSLVAVARDRRRSGVARLLIRELFQHTGVERIDLLAEPGSEEFYDSLPHRRFAGYRLYPASEQKDTN